MDYLRQSLQAFQSKQGVFIGMLAMLGSLLGLAHYYDFLRPLMIGIAIVLASLLVIVGIYFFYLGFKKYLQSYHLSHKAYYKQLSQRLKAMGMIGLFGRQSRHAHLPWFIMLGPSHAGKSTLLQLPSLSFSRMAFEALPSDNHPQADWLISNESLVIDVPSWYIMAEEARLPWHAFVRYLKKIRGTQSLQGVLIAISCNALLQDEQLITQIDRIRARVDALYQLMGRCLPIQIVITQCDQLRGFHTFFSQLDEKARALPWGMTFNPQSPIQAQLLSGMSRLYARLMSRQIQQLHVHDALNEKLDSLQFIQDLMTLKTKLEEVIGYVDTGFMHQEPLHLAGLYFTSALPMPIAGSEKKAGYFIHDLMKKQVITNAMPIHYSRKKIRQRRHIQSLQMAAIILGFTAVFGLVTHAYLTNLTLLRQGERIGHRLVEALGEPKDRTARLTLLETVGEHLHQLRYFNQMHPWYDNLGMNRANTQLPIYKALLAKGMDHDFYKPVEYAITQTLDDYHEQWMNATDVQRESLRGAYYADLTVYLMLKFPHAIDMAFAGEQLTRHWLALQAGQPYQQRIQRADLLHLSQIYLDHLSHLTAGERHVLLDDERRRIELARRDLFTSRGMRNQYAFIEYQFVSDLGVLDEAQWFEDRGGHPWHGQSSVPRFFTPAVYRQRVKPAFLALLTQDPATDWVIHRPLSALQHPAIQQAQQPMNKTLATTCLNALNATYFSHYMTAWVNWIHSIQAPAFQSTDDAAAQLHALSRPNGLFQRFFTRLKPNVSLKNMLSSRDYDQLPEAVRHRFMALETISGNGVKNVWHADYLKQLTQMEQALSQIALSPNRLQAAVDYTAAILGEQAHQTALYKTSLWIDTLSNGLDDRRLREAMKSFLLIPVQATYQSLMHDAMEGLQSTWEQTVVQPFQTHLAYRFPFNRHGEDATLADFSMFFSPQQGILATYMRTHLAPFIQREGGRFVSKQWQGIAMPFSASFLRKLHDMTTITQALFSEQNGELALQYAIYPIPTAGIKEILFVTMNRSYAYQNGPQEWVHFKWPEQENTDNETLLRITQSTENRQLVKEFQGAWGLFHLIQEAHMTRSDRGYQLEWTFMGKAANEQRIRVLLTAKNQPDPFASLLFNPLPLPDKLMG